MLLEVVKPRQNSKISEFSTILTSLKGSENSPVTKQTSAWQDSLRALDSSVSTEMSNKCAVCKKSATQTCSACGQVFYCAREHQKQDWKQHKNFCVPFKITTDEVLGRCVVATRNLRPGEVLMKQSPLILGPKVVSAPLCLSCHKKLNLEEKARYECDKCKWPLCGQECEASPLHRAECQVFAQAGFVPTVKSDNSRQPVYSSIAPLRALLLKRDHPEKFKILRQCQSHLSEHLATPVYQILRNNLVSFFIDVLKMDTDETEILTICSIFDTNCFDVRNPNGTVNVRGLYPTISLLSHDCKQNTRHSFHGDDFHLLLTATVPIKKGELITTTYTQTLWGTLTRRAHLKMSKHFDCTCDRCKDPTELGSYVGAVNCTECGDGSKIVSCNPLDKAADWKCQKCGFVIEGKEMVWGTDFLKDEISKLDKRDPKGFEEFLVKYKETLHQKSSFCLQVKYALIQMYGSLEGYRLAGKNYLRVPN
jgi:hypothetical protein